MRISDWSSYVCSSDLPNSLGEKTGRRIMLATNAEARACPDARRQREPPHFVPAIVPCLRPAQPVENAPIRHESPRLSGDEAKATHGNGRSEERRVGKGCVSPCRTRGSPYQ